MPTRRPRIEAPQPRPVATPLRDEAKARRFLSRIAVCDGFKSPSSHLIHKGNLLDAGRCGGRLGPQVREQEKDDRERCSNRDAADDCSCRERSAPRRWSLEWPFTSAAGRCAPDDFGRALRTSSMHLSCHHRFGSSKSRCTRPQSTKTEAAEKCPIRGLG